MITEHAVCALPDDHRDWHLLAIRVQWQRTTHDWTLNHQGLYLTLSGQWDPNFRAAARYLTADEALRVADHWKDRVEVNGRTAADILQRQVTR